MATPAAPGAAPAAASRPNSCNALLMTLGVTLALSIGVMLLDVSATYKVLELARVPAARFQPTISIQPAANSTPAAVSDPAVAAAFSGAPAPAIAPAATIDAAAAASASDPAAAAAAAADAAPTVPAAAATPTQTKKVAFHPPCDFTIGHLDAQCPRFVRTAPMATRGLGDRFVQMLIPFLVALDADAVPMPIQDDFLDTHGTHGAYAWAKDFFDLNRMLPFNDADAVLAAFPGLEPVKPVAEGDYDARLASVKDKCNAIIEVDFGICGVECYFAAKPNFQRLRSALACNFMRGTASRAGLPPLVFDQTEDEYVVAVHIRRGDITLNGSQAYFARLKAQVDAVLEDFPAVHYYFISEASDLGEGQPPFPFLGSIFPPNDRIKATYLNHLDPQASLLHMMNADMLVTTGSSFPYIAATISPKPVVLFGQPKEKGFFAGSLRDDFVLVDDAGSILSPSIAEATALVAIRYEEVHGRPFPYRRRRRRQRRRLLRASD